MEKHRAASHAVPATMVDGMARPSWQCAVHDTRKTAIRSQTVNTYHLFNRLRGLLRQRL